MILILIDSSDKQTIIEYEKLNILLHSMLFEFPM